MLKMARPTGEDIFREPKPTIDREFDVEVNFDWWHENTEMNYFIVATSRFVFKGEQIYNSYGERNNRFCCRGMDLVCQIISMTVYLSEC